MRLLHVSLGIPPLRTGGLTRYCCELMTAQVNKDNEVALLYPGHYSLRGFRIEENRPWNEIRVFELTNPLPVALTFGVAQPCAFMSTPADVDVYRNFLKCLKPDIVHVHSFMGIHREFFEIVHELGIPLIFHTHDYYPLCLRCTCIDATGSLCDKIANPQKCSACCSSTGMTLHKSLIMQSHLYAQLKSSKFTRIIGSKVKWRMEKVPTALSCFSDCDRSLIVEYENIIDYNKSIFSLFNVVVCNSRMTMNRFKTAFPEGNYTLLPITHSGLSFLNTGDCESRTVKARLSIGYFGGSKRYKGYYDLLEASRMLHRAHVPFNLNLYGDDYQKIEGLPEAIFNGRLDASEINDAMKSIDVVVVPSVYPETFGFIVLEAICAGCIVLCASCVGASELIDERCLFEPGDVNALASLLQDCSCGLISPAPLPQDYPLSMSEQADGLANIYASAIKG